MRMTWVFPLMQDMPSISRTAAASIQDKIDISAYFNTNTSEDQILNIKQSLESLSQGNHVGGNEPIHRRF